MEQLSKQTQQTSSSNGQNRQLSQDGSAGGQAQQQGDTGSNFAVANGQGDAGRAVQQKSSSANRPSETGAASAGGAGSAYDATPLIPAVDIFEDESGFTVIADLPGVARDQLTVRVTGDNLVIEGMAAAASDEGIELLYGEVSNPLYRRSFTLSRELDPSKIEAKLNNGVLRLTIPKAEAAKPRRISVSVG